LAAFDFDAALRWARFDPKKPLVRRADSALPFVREDNPDGHALLLDTCVYIDLMRDRAPGTVDRLLEARHVNHSTVAIQELMHVVGVMDPRDRRTAAAIAEIRGHIRAMPAYRVFVPEADVLGRAALLSGILCRVNGYAADSRQRALHDCVLFLQALRLGYTVLTNNVGDYDYLLQLVPAGRVLFYRRKPG
jgi:predicted nucleic acid-binding protein